MNDLKKLHDPNALASTARHYMAAIAIIAVVAVTASARPGRTRAAGGPDGRNNTQVAELYELQAAFHAAASHGGDIDAMMALWADDGSLTVGDALYSGKDAVRDFFANHSGAFKHDWVSLAPAFKTQFDIRGNTADLYFECHYADPSVTPYVLRSDISATGTAKKVNGTWVFWNIVAGSEPL
ncbi:MAG TPA: nuclear transport factor 2 family protein [Candidatus Binatia bacterium]|nr:nuclear transport factor 2 family protein [Candidatus Binatia bacterium]